MKDGAMMPPLEVRKSVRIKIGKKESLKGVIYHSTGKKPEMPSDKGTFKMSVDELVQFLADVYVPKPGLPPIKDRSMTQEEAEKCRNDFYDAQKSRNGV